MRKRAILLVSASLAYSSPTVFSVHDDLLAFPQVTQSSFYGLFELCSCITQYEVIFSDTYISDTDAESRLAFSSPSSSAIAAPTNSGSPDLSTLQETTGELSTRSNNGHDFTKADSTEFGKPSFKAPQSYEYMMLDSAPYLCSIPQVSITHINKTAVTNSKAEEEKELAQAADRGWELLKDMEGHCMYFISGWWSYSFCYNHHVKQFHQLPPGRGGVPVFPPMEDEATPSYVLGKFAGQRDQIEGQPRVRSGQSDESRDDQELVQMQTKGDMRYLVQKLNGGTTCDLTGKQRKVEVQFHCHPQSADRIGWIKEVSTCSYLMVIYTPRLCNDVAFLPPRETKANPIICTEIVSEDEVDDWKARKAAEVERKLVGSGSKSPTRPMVGGIEVGGQKLVGKEGQRIEPPRSQQAPDGPKPDIVAKSDPNEKGGKVQRLSNEDLKNMDLDPATVEKLRKELQELAGDKAWTLEVVDAPGGYRELRGIVEADEDEEGGEPGEGSTKENEGSEEVYKDEL